MPAKSGLKNEIVEATRQANILQKALQRATTDKGISFISLNTELRKAGTTAEQMVKTLGQAGPAFSKTFNVAVTSLATANRSVINISEKIREMQRVMTQSIKFTAAQTIQREFMSAISSSIRWVEDLNKALTDISVVTNKTGADLDKVYEKAIQHSKKLRVSASDYTEGSLIFYQQGLSDDEVERRTEITVKAAKAAGQSIDTMSSQLTSIWNNFKMVGEEQQRAASIGAKLAGATAVDFKDIAEAMQSTAAPAAQMGVEYEQLAAIIATVGDVSQQSASVIGNAYKTIFSRFQQLKTEGTDGEVTLNKVSKSLKEMGINVVDNAGNLRDLGLVINEVGFNWDSYSKNQQLAIAQLVGGTRQYGQFLTLMNNFDKYLENYSLAVNEDGSTLELQYTRSLDSIASHAENAGEAWKRAFSNVFEADNMKQFYSIIEDIGNQVGAVLEAFGGWKGILVVIASIMQKQIAQSIMNMAHSATTFVKNLTPAMQSANKVREANSIRANALKSVAKNDNVGQGSRDLVKNATTKGYSRKELGNQTADLKATQQTLMADQSITKSQKQQLQIMMQKADIYQKTGEMATKIQQIESRGTDQAKHKAEMLQEQLKTYNDQLLAMTDLNSKEAEENDRMLDGIEKEKKARQKAKEDRIEQAKSQVNTSDIDEKLNNAMARRSDVEKKKPRNSNSKKKKERQLESIDAEIEALQEELQKRIEDAISEALDEGIDEAVDNSDLDMKEGLAKLSKALNENMVDALTGEENPAMVIAKALSDEFEDSDNAIGRAITEKLNTIDLENIDLSGLTEEINSAINDALSAEGIDTSSEEIQEKISTALRSITEGSALESQGGNIFRSINDDLEDLGGSLDDAVAGLTGMTSGLALTVTGVQAMGDAIENVDFVTFITGLSTAIGGIVQFGSSAVQFAGSIGAIGKGLTSMGGAIASVIPGLGGVATAATSAAAAGTVAASAIAVAATTIGIAVAAIGALVYAWSEWKNSQPEAQMERLTESAEQLTSDLDAATSEAEALREAFDKYDSAVTALEECTRGTEEWRNALQEVNQAALDVLENLPSGADFDLRKLYSRNEEGMIELNRDEYSKIQEYADNRVATTDYAARIASINVDQKANEIAAVDSAKKLSQAMGLGETKVKEFTEILANGADKLVGKTGSELLKALQDLGINVQSVSNDTLLSLQKNLNELGLEVQNVKDKLNLIAQMKIDEILGDDYSGEVKQVVGDVLATGQEQQRKDLLAWMTGKDFDRVDAWSDSNSKDKLIKDTIKALEVATGGRYEADDNFVRGSKNNREFAFKDLNTGEVVKYRAEYLASIMSSTQSLEKLSQQAETVVGVFNRLDNTIDGKNSTGEQIAGAKAAKDYLTTGSLNNLSSKELASLTSEDADITEMLKQSFGLASNASEEELNKFALSVGKESFDALVEGIQTAAEQSLSAMEHAADGLSKTTKETFDSLTDIDQDMTVDEKEKLSGVLTQVFDNFGAEAISSFEDITSQMGDKVGDFVGIVDKIDWDTATPELLREKLKELKIDTSELTDVELQELIQTLQTVGNSSAAAAMELNAMISAVKGNIDGDNSIISDEDYQKLQAAGVEVDKYFTTMADGTHMLTEDADAFKQILDSVQIGRLQNALDDMANQAPPSEKFTESYINSAVKGDGIDNTTQARQQLEIMKEFGEITNTEFENLSEQLQKTGVDGANAISQINEKFVETGLNIDTIKEKDVEWKAQMKELQESIDLSEFSSEVAQAGLDMEKTSRYAERLKEKILAESNATEISEKEMRLYTKSAQEAAIANQKLDRGIGNISSNLEDYKKALTEANQGTIEYSEAMDDLKANLADIVNFDDPDLLTDAFARATLESQDLQLALQGDTEAILRLQEAAGDKMMIDIVANQVGVDAEGNYINDITPDKIKADWEKLKAQFEGFGDLVAPGVNQEKLITSFNEMIKNGKMTKDQIEAALAALHVSADVVTTYTTSTEMVPLQVTEEYWEENPSGDKKVEIRDEEGKVVDSYVKHGYKKLTKSYTAGYEEATVAMPSYEIKGTEGDGSQGVAFIPAPTPTVSSGGSSFSPSKVNSNSGGGGGKGSSPKPAKTTSSKPSSSGSSSQPKVVKQEEHRYENIDSSINSLKKSLDKLSSSEEDAWGAAKLRKINAVNRAIAEQNRLVGIRLGIAKDYYESDKKGLADNTIFKNSGMTIDDLTFNRDGTISNIEQVKNALFKSTYGAYMGAIDSGAVQASDSIKQAKEELETLTQQMMAGTQNSVADMQRKIELEKMIAEAASGTTIAGIEPNEDAYKEALDWLDKINDSAEQVQQAFVDLLQGMRDQMAKIQEEISARLDFKIKVRDKDLQRIEKLIDRWGDLGIMNDKAYKLYAEALDEMSKKVDDFTVAGKDALATVQLLQEAREGNESAREDLIKLFKLEGDSLEALNKYLDGNEGLPEEIMTFLDDIESQTEDLFNEIVDTALEQLDSIFQKINEWMDKTFAEAERTLSLNESIINFWKAQNEFIGLDKSTTWGGQQSQRAIMLAEMKGKEAQLTTNIAQREAYLRYIDQAEEALVQIREKMGGLTEEEAKSIVEAKEAEMQAAKEAMDKASYDAAQLYNSAQEIYEESLKAGLSEAEAREKQQEKLKEANEAEAEAAAAGEEYNIARLWVNFGAGAESAITQQIDEWREKADDLLTTIVDSETEIFEVAMNNIEQEKEMAKKRLGKIFGGLFTDLDDLSEMYNAIKSAEDFTLDDYDKNYHVNRLQGMYDSIAEDLDVSQMQEFSNWLEKLNSYKEEGKAMTEDEVALLEKEFEIAKEKAAWQEAQNRKTSMKLKRDASGNYSYVYSADSSSQMEDNLQNIRDLEFEYKQMLDGVQDDYMQRYIQLGIQMQDTMDNINWQLWQSDSQYRNSIILKIQAFQKEMDAINEATGNIFDNLAPGIAQTTEGLDAFADMWSNSAGAIVTGKEKMQIAFEELKKALVGEKFNPENLDQSTYFGAIMFAQKYWANEANDALTNSVKNMSSSTKETGIPYQFSILTNGVKLELDKIYGTGGYYSTFTTESEDLMDDIDEYLLSDKNSIKNSYITLGSNVATELETNIPNSYSKFWDSVNLYMNGGGQGKGSVQGVIPVHAAYLDAVKTNIGSADDKPETNTVMGRYAALISKMTDIASGASSAFPSDGNPIVNWWTSVSPSLEAAIGKLGEIKGAIDAINKTQLYDKDMTITETTVKKIITEPTPTDVDVEEAPQKEVKPSNSVVIGAATTTGGAGKDVGGGGGDEKVDYTTSEIAEGIGAAIWINGTDSGWYLNNNKKNGWAYLVRQDYGEDMVQEVSDNINAYGLSGKYQDMYYRGPGNTSLAYSNGTVFYRKSSGGIQGAYTGGLVSERGIYELAEKGPEIVLNADDTKNILAAVAMMRQTVAGQLGSLNGSLAGVTNSIASSVSSPVTNNTNNNNSVQQDVRIEASFPGVSVAQEIEDAFNSLLNQVAQYNIKK